MAKFDAETYLRMRGEEMLLAQRDNRGFGTPLGEPAAALVAIGALRASRARSVIDDYEFAEALRSEHGMHHRTHFAIHRRRRARGAQRPLPPRRVIPCDHKFETSSGELHVHRVSLAADEAQIAITLRMSSSNRPGRRSFGPPNSPPHATIEDDRGTSVTAGFSGGGGDVWTGHFQAHGLAKDTAWLVIDGERIELVGEPSPSEVAIEELPEQPLALRYLWHELEARDHWHGESKLDGAIDALLAAGALAGDEPELDEIRGVATAAPRHPGMQRHAGPGAAGLLREPWKSALIARPRSDGRFLNLALDATTPVFEGFSVAISSVESDREHFGIEVDVAPGLGGHPRFSTALDAPRLGWWAADDRGRHFLGGWNGWHGAEDRTSGTINFAGPIHPRAKQVRIMPTALRTRAVITIPLPDARP